MALDLCLSCWVIVCVCDCVLSYGMCCGVTVFVLMSCCARRSSLLSVVVAPFSLGDTPLQHYNSLFALSHVNVSVAGICLCILPLSQRCIVIRLHV